MSSIAENGLNQGFDNDDLRLKKLVKLGEIEAQLKGNYDNQLNDSSTVLGYFSNRFMTPFFAGVEFPLTDVVGEEGKLKPVIQSGVRDFAAMRHTLDKIAEIEETIKKPEIDTQYVSLRSATGGGLMFLLEMFKFSQEDVFNQFKAGVNKGGIDLLSIVTELKFETSIRDSVECRVNEGKAKYYKYHNGLEIYRVPTIIPGTEMAFEYKPKMHDPVVALMVFPDRG